MLNTDCLCVQLPHVLVPQTLCLDIHYLDLSGGKKGGLFHGPILYFTLFTTFFILPVKPQFPNQDITSKLLSPHLFGPCRKYNYFNNFSCRNINFISLLIRKMFELLSLIFFHYSGAFVDGTLVT